MYDIHFLRLKLSGIIDYLIYRFFLGEKFDVMIYKLSGNVHMFGYLPNSFSASTHSSRFPTKLYLSHSHNINIYREWIKLELNNV